jgi:hypothetical protein
MELTNKFNLPEVFFQACKVFDSEYADNQKSTFSISDLNKPAYMKALEIRHKNEIQEDVSDRIWSLFGSALHSVLEKSAEKMNNAIFEERLTVSFDGVEISGKPDFFDGKILQDYKSTSVWKYIYKDFSDWEKQLNCYAYLFSNHGFEVEKLEVIAIFRDWQKSKAKYDNNYPQSQVTRIEIDKWDHMITYNYIINKIVGLHNAIENTDICDVCSESERWQSKDVFAVMKTGRKSAVKLCDSDIEAKGTIENLGNGHYIENRKGEPKRCNEYCRVNSFCRFYKEFKNVE